MRTFRFEQSAAGVLLACLGAAAGCSSDGDGDGTGGAAATGGSAGGSLPLAGGGNSAVGSGGTSAGTASAAGGSIAVAGSGPSAGTAGAGGGAVCATQSARADLEPVYLAFAFDVSGSMGKGDFPWHDATLKWDPVVSATRDFFEDPASAGLRASLTVFPKEEEDDRCDPDEYEDPEVPMTALPSPAFGEELDAIREEDWRGGTPTLAAVEGVLSFIDQYSDDNPGRYVFVLVTDGYPQGCDDQSIESVEDAVRAVADEIPTYVIGVNNPPLTDDDGTMAPDTVSNLVGIAEAGGTETAFLIDTGDPSETSAAFQAAVERIRGSSIACNLAIPSPPDGREFEKDKVIVSYASGSNVEEFTYDAECESDDGWHYDDIDNPSEVILCESACSAVQSDPMAELSVSFTCETVIDDVPR